MIKPRSSDSPAFTIIELMIATTVFSVILLICAAGLIQIGRIYQKGVINNQTQEVARTVITRVSESIQFTGGSIRKLSANNGSQGFCVDNKQYSYLPNKKLVDGTPTSDQTKHALVVNGSCTTNNAQDLSAASVVGDELLSPNMRVLKLAICVPGDTDVANCPTPPPANSNLYQVNLIIGYGDGDLFSAGACKSLSIGGSFCAVSSLSTTVQKRIIK
jgi:prepilin-type N-terminal cleavage/methylation domain-containing protein